MSKEQRGPDNIILLLAFTFLPTNFFVDLLAIANIRSHRFGYDPESANVFHGYLRSVNFS